MPWSDAQNRVQPEASKSGLGLFDVPLFCEDVRHRGFLAWTLVIEAMVRVRL
jgi:hypothetical protein